jgi:ADP-heptose:LPS heptosyltransferase
VRFAAVAAALRERGHDVVVTGGPGEQPIVEAIADEARVRPAEPMALDRLIALVAGARLVISGDTGVAHVATNFATPSVVLFGPVSPATWGPPPQPRHQVLWHGDGRGDPHAGRVDAALLQITVDEVLGASERALAVAGGH